MYDLVPGDLISDYIAFTGEYEPGLTREVVALANQGGTFIDIGANLGYFSLLWASANKGNKCLAFEASPRNIRLLAQNVLRNGMSPQISVVGRAAGHSAGKLQFSTGPVEQTGWGGFASSKTANTVEVDVVRVDEMVSENEQIALLKVDIEGADAWALMGCERLLKNRCIQKIWFEENKPRMKELGIAPGTAQHYLQSVGYVCTAQSDPASDLVDWSAEPA
jgi:FkbM family methyltransferase